ncbi:MAG: response regulator [Clostridiales bacterium]|jgi:putative two-component system response regulator|nr:response regulator [Clostridiales bacterium]
MTADAGYPINRSVLIVDDDATNLKALQEILGKSYKVYPAPNGDRALLFLEKTIPGLILLDVKMPGLNGYDMIKILKQNPRLRDIPVIFLTAQESRDKEEQAFQLGAVDYILKPISAGVVQKRVQLHLELQSYRKNLEELVTVRTNQLQKTQDTILEILANLTAYRDNETGCHLQRTTWYARRLVDCLREKGRMAYRISGSYAENIVKSAKLHDIGKVAISDGILLKPGPLTPDEFAVIKTHTTLGARIIDHAMKELGDDSDFLLVAKEIVYTHHEWWNGAGYPRGLAGGKIPLSGRLMAIADVYDALSSERPYKKSYSHEKALEIMWAEAGTHLDPHLMELAKDVLSGFDDAVYAYKEEPDYIDTLYREALTRAR